VELASWGGTCSHQAGKEKVRNFRVRLHERMPLGRDHPRQRGNAHLSYTNVVSLSEMVVVIRTMLLAKRTGRHRKKKVVNS